MTHAIPAAALAQHVAILGKTGSGKTSTAKLAVEQVVAEGARVCVLDPIKSDWWGLTSSADGKRPGLPFHILGGPRGHVPLHERAGKAIGEIVATGALPLSIIDMADFAPGGQAHFFVDFAPTLIRRMRGVIYLVIEEAHLLAPKERSGVGAENMSIHWAKTLATAGRSKGIRLILLSQRVQALHNALLGSCDTLIAHRLTAPADQAPVLQWLKANVTAEIREKVASSLSSLRTGSGWLCSGEARIFDLIHFPRIHTYDNTATPTGDGQEHDVRTAPVDQEKLRAIVGEAVAVAEASDPKLLKERIAELTKALDRARLTAGQQQPAAPNPDALAVARDEGRRAGFDDGQREGLRIGQIQGRKQAADRLRSTINATLDEIVRGSRYDSGPRQTPTALPTAVEQPGTTTAAQAHAAGRKGFHDEFVSAARGAGGGAELRILKVLAQRHPARFTKAQWATLAGMKKTGGTWNTYVSRLRTAGHIEESGTGGGGLVGCTAAGLGAAGALPPAPATSADVIAMWRNALGGEVKLLDVLVARYPDPIDRANLADLCRMTATGGTFSTYLSRLRSNGLVEETGRRIVAAEILFRQPRLAGG